MTAVVFRLPSENPSALCLQLQLTELPLVERIYRRPHWLNRVEVIALPLHPAFVEVAAGFHSDEVHVQKCADTFHYSVLGDSCSTATVSGSLEVTV